MSTTPLTDAQLAQMAKYLAIAETSACKDAFEDFGVLALTLLPAILDEIRKGREGIAAALAEAKQARASRHAQEELAKQGTWRHSSMRLRGSNSNSSMPPGNNAPARSCGWKADL